MSLHGRWLTKIGAYEITVGAVYFLCALLGWSVTVANAGTPLVAPASGVAAALLIRFKHLRWMRALAAIFVAALSAQHVLTSDSFYVDLWIAAADTVQVGAMAWVYRKWIKFPIPDITIEQAAHMTLIFGLCIPALGALACVPVEQGAIAGSSLSIVHRWLADSLGACLVGPAIVLFSGKAIRRLVSRRYLMRNIILAGFCLTGCFFSIRYANFPFVLMAVSLLIAAFSLGGFGTAALSLACSAALVSLWLWGIRPAGFVAFQYASTWAAHPIWAMVVALMPPIAVGLGSDDRRRANRALRFSERRFRDSMERSPIGAVLVDLSGRWTQTNAAIQRMLGYSAEELHAMPNGRLTHEDEQVDIRVQRQRLRSGEIEFYEAERRYLHKEGGWIHARTVVSLVRDEEGMPLHYIAQIESIQKRRVAEQALKDERERLKTTLRAIADAVVTTDSEQHVTYVNAAAEEILGQSLETAAEFRFNDIVVLTHPVTLKPAPDLIGDCLRTAVSARLDEALLLHRPDGSICYVTQAVTPVRGADGGVTGTVIVLHDVSANYQRDKEMTHRAAHDALTGLANRFEFGRRARKTFDRARLLGLPSAVIAIDLDRFKSVNDAGGHAAGDAVLLNVASALTSFVRRADTVARLGGDEFAIVLENCARERVESLAQQLLSSLNPLQTEWNGTTFGTGASIGVAMMTESFTDEVAWLAAADQACYQAKREGRGGMRAA